MTYIVVVALIAAIAAAIFFAVRAYRVPGYRGAIGFKNRHTSEIAHVSATGFSQLIECRALSRGGHSFNFIGRQDLPGELQVTWRLVGESAEKKVTIPLSSIPKDATDGELFLVLSDGGDWMAEYSPKLRTEKLD